MKLNREGVQLNAEERNKRNQNWTTLEDEVSQFESATTEFNKTTGTLTGDITLLKAETAAQKNGLTATNKRVDNVVIEAGTAAYEKVVDASKLIWKEPVVAFSNLATAYPQAQNGWAAQTTSDGAVYRYDGSTWKKIQQVDAGPVNALDTRLTAQLAEIVQVDPKTFGVVGDGITDDTIALNRLGDYLGEFGGKVTFNKKYLISAPFFIRFKNDISVEFDSTADSLFTCKNVGVLSFYNAIQAMSIDTVQRGTFACKVNVDGKNLGTGYGQQSRMQAVTATRLKNVFIKDSRLTDVYGTGVFVAACSGFVYVARNKLKDVWGYNATTDANGVFIYDSYGDGIYVAGAITGGIIEGNEIIRNLEGAEEVGRIGIVLEFDTKNCDVKNNTIKGYNRGIHIEQTQGGHTIRNNKVSACPIAFLTSGEKGNAETIVENNLFTTEGYIHKGKPLSFYDAIVFIGLPVTGHNPKYKIRNNKVTQVKVNAEVPMLLSINCDNVVVEGSNEFIADINSTSKNREIYAGSYKNTRINTSKFANISNFDISYAEIEIMNNILQIESMNTNFSKMKNEKNVYNPTGATVGKILGVRPSGTFNQNTINNFSATTIDNTLFYDNVASCEVSENTFNRNTADSPVTPMSKTPENKADTMYTLRRNTLNDKVLSTVRRIVFEGGWRESDGRRIVYTPTAPNWGTWAKGDEWRVPPSAVVSGGFMGGVCITAGNPGTWRNYGQIL